MEPSIVDGRGKDRDREEDKEEETVRGVLRMMMEIGCNGS